MMHRNMKQIAIWKGYARPIVARFVVLWKDFSIELKFGGMMHSNMKQIAI